MDRPPPVMPEGFGLLLRDTLAELAERSGAEAPPDPVERLGLEAQQAILATAGAPLPRGGGRDYWVPVSLPPDPATRALDLRS